MQIVVTINAGEVAQSIQGVISSLSNKSISDWFKSKVDPIISTSIMKNFSEEGRPSWSPLSDEYALRRPSSPMLVISGKLRDMFRHLTGKEIAGGYGREYPRDTESVEYYKYHQTGTAKMPQREIVGLQQEDIEDIYNSINDWIETKIRLAGWR